MKVGKRCCNKTKQSCFPSISWKNLTWDQL